MPLHFEVDRGRFRHIHRTPPSIGSRSILPLDRLKPEAFLSLASSSVVDLQGLTVLPGMIDAHVHVRDPGLTHKEDWSSFSKAALKGGVTCAMDMPNTIPATMGYEDVLGKAAIARERCKIDFRLFLGLSLRNLNQVSSLLEDRSLPLCGLKVYYGQSTGELMFDDLETLAKVLPKEDFFPVVFHSEDQCMIDHHLASVDPNQLDQSDPEIFHLHSQIRSSEVAHRSTQVILDWAIRHGRRVHIAHLSTPLEVELIEAAKKQGGKISSEVAPHHLLFCEDDYPRLGAKIKMNPPVRSHSEMRRLGQFFSEGKIELFATDHAPHLLSEKHNSLRKSPSGVPSIEYFLPLLLKCAKEYGLPIGRAVEMASSNPADLFHLPDQGKIHENYHANFVVFQWREFSVTREDVTAKCGWSPYEGMILPGFVRSTFYGGELCYQNLSS